MSFGHILLQIYKSALFLQAQQADPV